MLFSISRLGSISTFHEKRKKPQKKGKNVPTNSNLKNKTCLGFNLTYGRNHRHLHTSWDVKNTGMSTCFCFKRKISPSGTQKAFRKNHRSKPNLEEDLLLSPRKDRQNCRWWKSMRWNGILVRSRFSLIFPTNKNSCSFRGGIWITDGSSKDKNHP